MARQKTIDRKFKILAVNPCKPGAVYTDADGFFFKATDEFTPDALIGYIAAMKKSARVGPLQIESAELLLERVLERQRIEGKTTPGIDIGCEAERCIGGKGVE